MRRFLLAFLLAGSFAGIYVAHAQVGSTDPLTISINPDYPRPYQIVTVTPESSLIDLSASTVTFTVNGKVVQRGSGSESANVAMGGPGQATTIKITAVNNGSTYSKSITIRPADVALIIEPNTTTHPFYEGGAILGGESRVRLIAMPDLRTSSGALIAPSNLVYTWKNGDQILQAQSGIGKNVLTAVAPVRYRDTVITVTVSSQDQSVVGQAQASISPTDPIIRIYENDPLLGVRYENAFTTKTTLTGSEATYRAVPYFFSSTPNLTWSVNGTASQQGKDITVRPAGNGKGTALLGVAAKSQTPLQSASASLSVSFGSLVSSIFGL